MALKKLGDGCNLLGDGGLKRLGDGGNFFGDGGDPLGDGGVLPDDGGDQQTPTEWKSESVTYVPINCPGTVLEMETLKSH